MIEDTRSEHEVYLGWRRILIQILFEISDQKCSVPDVEMISYDEAPHPGLRIRFYCQHFRAARSHHIGVTTLQWTEFQYPLPVKSSKSLFEPRYSGIVKQ